VEQNSNDVRIIGYPNDPKRKPVEIIHEDPHKHLREIMYSFAKFLDTIGVSRTANKIRSRY
jgi:hypothetical protein